MTRLSRLALALLVAASAAAAQDMGSARQSLKGLKGVAVLVEDLDAEAQRAGLNERILQTDVELKLRQAGIRVLTREESLNTPGTAQLYINVGVGSAIGKFSLYSYSTTVSLHQDVYLKRDPHIIVFGAATWSVPPSFGLAPGARLATVVRDAIKDDVDRFINAYLSVNPKKGT